MAFTGIMCTEAEIQAKEGADVSTDVTDVMHTAWTLQAESFVNNMIRYNFSDNYATLNVDVKYLLTEYVSSLVAMNGINYNLDAYPTLAHAQTMLNFLYDRTQKIIAILKDKKREDFIINA